MKDSAEVTSKCKHFLSMILAIFLYPQYQESVIQLHKSQKFMPRPLEGAWSGASQARVSVKMLTDSQGAQDKVSERTGHVAHQCSRLPEGGSHLEGPPGVPQRSPVPETQRPQHTDASVASDLPGERPVSHSSPASKSIGRKRGEKGFGRRFKRSRVELNI